MSKLVAATRMSLGAPGGAASANLGFAMQQQVQTNWCWGAVSVSTLRAAVASHDLAVPHEVFTLDLSSFSKGLKGAKATGWRYLVMNSEEVIAAAELDRPAKGSTGGPTFSNVNTGGFVSSSLAALKTAEELVEE